MTTIFNILLQFMFWAVFAAGAFYVLYVLVFIVWPKIAWRVVPKKYKRLKEQKLKEARFFAKQQGLKQYKYPREKNTTIIVWASSQKAANRIYENEKKNNFKRTEIFE